MAAMLLTSMILVYLLLSLMPAGAGADTVTWRKCKVPRDYRGRVLESSLESTATWLQLTSCHLSEIKPGDFNGLPNVETIWLKDNDIEHVDTVVFRSVPKLKELSLWQCKLREVPFFDEHSFCPSLIELDLDKNVITEIKHARTFAGCVKLQELDLRRNFIEYIHPKVFRPLSELRKLNLNSNKILFIPGTMFINNKLQFLHLSGNRITQLPFDFVSELKTASNNRTQQHIFFEYNDWHCACLLELLADVKRAGVGYFHPQYSGMQPVCVYFGMYPCFRSPPSQLLHASRRSGSGPQGFANTSP